jgi:hypothetical protein
MWKLCFMNFHHNMELVVLTFIKEVWWKKDNLKCQQSPIFFYSVGITLNNQFLSENFHKKNRFGTLQDVTLCKLWFKKDKWFPLYLSIKFKTIHVSKMLDQVIEILNEILHPFEQRININANMWIFSFEIMVTNEYYNQFLLQWTTLQRWQNDFLCKILFSNTHNYYQNSHYCTWKNPISPCS